MRGRKPEELSGEFPIPEVGLIPIADAPGKLNLDEYCRRPFSGQNVTEFLGVPGSGKTYWASLYLKSRELELEKQGYEPEDIENMLAYLAFEDVQDLRRFFNTNSQVRVSTRTARQYEEDTQWFLRAHEVADLAGLEIVSEAPGVLGRGDAVTRELASWNAPNAFIWISAHYQIVRDASQERWEYERRDVFDMHTKLEVLKARGVVKEDLQPEEVYIGGRKGSDFDAWQKMWRQYASMFLYSLLWKLDLYELVPIHRVDREAVRAFAEKDPMLRTLHTFFHGEELEKLLEWLPTAMRNIFTLPENFVFSTVRNRFAERVFLPIYFSYMGVSPTQAIVTRHDKESLTAAYKHLRKYNLFRKLQTDQLLYIADIK